METQGQCNTGLARATASLIGVLLISVLLAATVRAENLSRYHPQALVDAEWALQQGEPARALAHLHRQRALLRQAQFRGEADALACQAYRQMEDWRGVSRTCVEAVAYDRDSPEREVNASLLAD